MAKFAASIKAQARYLFPLLSVGTPFLLAVTEFLTTNASAIGGKLTDSRETPDLPRLQHNGQSQYRANTIDRQELPKTWLQLHTRFHDLLQTRNLLDQAVVNREVALDR
jgi:hypothetical protein